MEDDLIFFGLRIVHYALVPGWVTVPVVLHVMVYACWVAVLSWTSLRLILSMFRVVTITSR